MLGELDYLARRVAARVLNDHDLDPEIRAARVRGALSALLEVHNEIASLPCWIDPATGKSGFNLGNDEDGEAGGRMAVLEILETALEVVRGIR